MPITFPHVHTIELNHILFDFVCFEEGRMPLPRMSLHVDSASVFIRFSLSFKATEKTKCTVHDGMSDPRYIPDENIEDICDGVESHHVRLQG